MSMEWNRRMLNVIQEGSCYEVTTTLAAYLILECEAYYLCPPKFRLFSPQVFSSRAE
jgi:hypothetical protein